MYITHANERDARQKKLTITVDKEVYEGLHYKDRSVGVPLLIPGRVPSSFCRRS